MSADDPASERAALMPEAMAVLRDVVYGARKPIGPKVDRRLKRVLVPGGRVREDSLK